MRARFRLFVVAVLPVLVTFTGDPNAAIVPDLYVTPDGDFDPNRAKNTSGFTTVFTIENTTSSDIFPEISCWGTGGVTCTNLTTLTKPIWAFSSKNVTATYSVGSQGGQIWVDALGGSYSDTGHKVVTTSPTLTLVTPAVTQNPDTGLVHTRTPLILATYSAPDATLDTTTLVVRLGNDTVTTLARRNRSLVEWEVDVAHQLSPGTVRDLYVKICHTNAGCSEITRKVLLDNSGPPIVSFAGMPLERFGGEAEVDASIAIPAYYSFGSARAPGLVYSTRQSYPRALVNVDLELTWPVSNPDQIKAVLFNGAVRMDSLVVSSPSCQAAGGRLCRVTLQGDFSGDAISTRAMRKWLKVEVMVVSGATTKTTVDSVEVVLVDRRGSPYGSGWFVGGIARLDSAGSDMILVGPTGTATLYRGSAGVFLSPPGSVEVLTWTGSQWWITGRPRGSTDASKVVFDSLGRLVATIDAAGNDSRVRYAGSSIEQIDSLMDPVDKRVTLTYSSGKLSSMTDPGGRQTKVSINGSNQLVYDSLASSASMPATATFSYTSYGGNNTMVLSSWADALGQTSTVTYDARRRPTQTTFPAVLPDTGASTVSPIVSQRPQVLRGLDTLLSADSVFGHSRNPMGYWTRAALNRWGQATKVWDSLGTLSRAAYSPEGRVQWSEGIVADSTRAYQQYDAIGRPLRSYRLRTSSDTVLLDSIVYDATYNRALKTFNALRQATEYAYNSLGQVTKSITPTVDTTTYQYLANGLLQKTRPPGETGWTTYTYNSTWQNLETVANPVGELLRQDSLDAYGRVIQSRSRVVARVAEGAESGDTAYYRWRRTRTGYTLLNQLDSARTEMTDECVAPCATPPSSWPSHPSDSLKWQQVKYAFDRLGRDTARYNTRGKRTRYVYDALGRLRARYPFGDSTAVVDSFRYNLAGQQRFHWTRRAHEIERRYDALGRDTVTLVPGVGNYRRTYGGPNGELTRLWIDSYVDSIGGVNPEVRWGLSQAGQLLADTAQGNRMTTYAADRYARDSLITDVTGSWRYRYDAVRGLLDSVVTPFGDTLVWSHDEEWRALGPYVRNGANPDYSIVPTWDSTGKLVDIATSHVVTVGRWQLPSEFEPYSPHDPVVPTWSETRGSGGATVTGVDSLTHDGWSRIVAARYMKNGSLVTTDSFEFTRDGNVRYAGETWDFDATTTRLLSRPVAGDTVDYEYDAAGNLISADDGTYAWAYSYDALDRLVAARRNGTLIARYAYDVLGRRIVKRDYLAGGTANYIRMIYRGTQVRAETDSVGSTLSFAYTWAQGIDNLIAIHRYSDGGDWYAVLDHLGTVRGLTERDGTWVASWRYRIYGYAQIPLDSAGAAPFHLRYRWTGREYDKETGLYYFRARYFDPGAARFTQEDPIGFAGGMNLYAYGDGNPTDGKDPDGMMKDYDHLIYKKLLRSHRPAVYIDGAQVGGGGISDAMWGDVAASMIEQQDRRMQYEYMRYLSGVQAAVRATANSFRSDPDDPLGEAAALLVEENSRPLSFSEFARVHSAIEAMGGLPGAVLLSSMLGAGRVFVNPYGYPAPGWAFSHTAVGTLQLTPDLLMQSSRFLMHILNHEAWHFRQPGWDHNQIIRAGCADLMVPSQCPRGI